MKVFTSTASFPNSPYNAFGAVVGSAISTAYNSGILDYTYKQIQLFRTLESDPDVIAQGLIEPVETEGGLFDAFKAPTLADYKATPLWTAFTGLNANTGVSTAKRRYLLKSPNAANLYMEVEVGVRGVGPTQNSYMSVQRPYIKLNFSNESTFASVICSKDFSVKDAYDNSSTSSGANGATGQLRYMLSKNTLVIYCHFLHMTSVDYHALGKTQTFTRPFHIPLGVTISVGDYFTPLSPSAKAVFAITSPSYEAVGAGSANQYGFAAAASKGSIIVHNQFFETRAISAPQAGGGAITTSNPPRNFVAPFTHIFGNGTILNCPDLVILSDPRRDTIDFIQANIMYGGVATEFAVLPMMQSHPNSNVDWMAPAAAFSLGLKI